MWGAFWFLQAYLLSSRIIIRLFLQRKPLRAFSAIPQSLKFCLRDCTQDSGTIARDGDKNHAVARLLLHFVLTARHRSSYSGRTIQAEYNSMNRRQFGLKALAAAAATAVGSNYCAFAAPPLADPRAFSLDHLRIRARQLAEHPFQAPHNELPQVLYDLTYDQYRDIRFRPQEALWNNRAPFSVQFFHPGFYYKLPVRIYEVVDEHARELRYSPALFDFGANDLDTSRFEQGVGFAGFRLHTALNAPAVLDELAAFLGASYFRALGRHMNYGLSARGLAIGTASDEGEEFPHFSEFYLERPRDPNSVVVHALLNSQSVTGVYTFTIRPGVDTVMDVAVALYTRRPIDKIGIAPLTSMFFFGANDRLDVDDFRPEVHDSDGLMIWNGSGEWIWRPLVNPQRLRVSTFVDRNPKGFGLMQRNRDFNSYQDLESRYDTRPSVWVEPVGNWGAGGVMLVEIPTAEEVNDNIVAFWRPEKPLAAGAEWQGAYRLHWCPDIDFIPQQPGRVVATRVGRGSEDSARKFVIDFAGGALPITSNAKISAKLTASHGKIKHNITHFNDVTSSWRVVFEVVQEGDPPIELRCYLAQDDVALTETWSYQWTE
jgi:periplasmic glucans biosynthesis protein